MKRIKVRDKYFQLYITQEEIRSAIKGLAERMNSELADEKPLFLCVLNGSFMFASDLMKDIDFVECEISFVKLASYDGDQTTGKVKQLIGLNEDLKGRTVVVLEDIVDTGITICNIKDQLKTMNPKQVKIATMLLKPDALQKEVDLDYVGLEIPNDFIVGYGLDYNGQGRSLTDIYSVVE